MCGANHFVKARENFLNETNDVVLIGTLRFNTILGAAASLRADVVVQVDPTVRGKLCSRNHRKCLVKCALVILERVVVINTGPQHCPSRLGHYCEAKFIKLSPAPIFHIAEIKKEC